LRYHFPHPHTFTVHARQSSTFVSPASHWNPLSGISQTYTAPLALVLLPGMDGSGALFADFVAALGEDILPQVLSYPVDQALSYQALVDVALAQLPVGQPFMLLGESFSGPVAIAIAAARPAGMVGLILSCSFARNPVPLLRFAKVLLPLLPVSAKFTALAMPLLLGKYATSALQRTLRDQLDRLSPAVLRARMRAVLTVDYTAQLHTIAMPVLYLQALGDRVVTAGAARHIQAHLPSVRLAALRGPHLLLQAAPSEAAALVNGFVREVRVNQPGR
jgi:pimeloyl-[acyl-carrier protein] methyl ester esterase